MSLDIVDACLLGARAAVRSGLFRPQATSYSRARRRSIFVRAISGFGAVTAASLVLGLASCTSSQVGSASASVALSAAGQAKTRAPVVPSASPTLPTSIRLEGTLPWPLVARMTSGRFLIRPDESV